MLVKPPSSPDISMFSESVPEFNVLTIDSPLTIFSSPTDASFVPFGPSMDVSFIVNPPIVPPVALKLPLESILKLLFIETKPSSDILDACILICSAV